MILNYLNKFSIPHRWEPILCHLLHKVWHYPGSFRKACDFASFLCWTSRAHRASLIWTSPALILACLPWWCRRASTSGCRHWHIFTFLSWFHRLRNWASTKGWPNECSRNLCGSRFLFRVCCLYRWRCQRLQIVGRLSLLVPWYHKLSASQ